MFTRVVSLSLVSQPSQWSRPILPAGRRHGPESGPVGDLIGVPATMKVASQHPSVILLTGSAAICAAVGAFSGAVTAYAVSAESP